MVLASEAGESRVVLDNIRWETFETLLAETGPRRGLLAYEEGTLEIMSPSSEHELTKTLIGALIEGYAQELGIDLSAVGSMTLKRKIKQRGAEPDESYYVQTEALVRGRRHLELENDDPPPDLVIEIQLTQSALDKLRIYGSLGVPEVWLWAEGRIRVYSLDTTSSSEAPQTIPTYTEQERSRALPDFPVDALPRWIAELDSKSLTRIVNDFRARIHADGGA